MKNNWMSMDLFLFDGGAAAGAGAAGAGEGAGGTGEGMTGMDAASQRAEEQTADAAQETPQRNYRAEWNKLKNSEEYKPFFAEDTQGIINKRFGDDKALKESNKYDRGSGYFTLDSLANIADGLIASAAGDFYNVRNALRHGNQRKAGPRL